MARRDVSKHLHTFADEIDRETRSSCRIPTRSSKASDETGSYWIGRIHEHNREFFGQRQCGRDVWGVHCNDHIRLQRQKLGRCLVYPLDLIAEQATIDNEIATST